MKRIGIISDTHNEIPQKIFNFLNGVDEIWHIGDIGSIAILDQLSNIATLRAVYGNIDNHIIRSTIPETQIFTCEGILVVMLHIGGYPGRYQRKARLLIESYRPKLFISGHSHILKIIYDKKHNLLHINPGAAGKKGFHNLITAVKLSIDDGLMSDMEIFELDRKHL